jgi:pimeloyl-ACP methyl ester carboxylesterase
MNTHCRMLCATGVIPMIAISAVAQDGDFKSGYASLNGLKMYYEIHDRSGGKKPPLVLLHGGGSTIDTTFGRVLPSLARTREVVAFEQQGHGHTVLAGMIGAKTRLHSRVIKAVTVGGIAQLYTDFTTVDDSG